MGSRRGYPISNFVYLLSVDLLPLFLKTAKTAPTTTRPPSTQIMTMGTTIPPIIFRQYRHLEMMKSSNKRTCVNSEETHEAGARLVSKPLVCWHALRPPAAAHRHKLRARTFTGVEPIRTPAGLSWQPAQGASTHATCSVRAQGSQLFGCEVGSHHQCSPFDGDRAARSSLGQRNRNRLRRF